MCWVSGRFDSKRLATAACIVALLICHGGALASDSPNCSTVTADDLLDWAESRFPDLLPRGAAQRFPSITYAGTTYIARVYAGSFGSRYLGVATDGRVFGLGDFTNFALTQFQTLAYWSPQVELDKCPNVAITLQPGNAGVRTGQRATFTTAATSSQALSFQWYRDGIPILGATTATYTTPDVELSQNGSVYVAEIVSGGRTIRTAGATLTVTPDARDWFRFLWSPAGRIESNGLNQWADGTLATESFALYLVNPDSPTTPILLEGAGQASSVITLGIEPEQSDFLVYSGTVRFPALTRAGAYGYITYIKGDRFRKVDLARAGATPQSTLLSSLNTRQVCQGAAFINDPVTPIRSLVLVNTPSASGSCSAGFAIRLALPMDLGPSDAPLEAAGTILSTLRSGDGGLRGFLVRRDKQIVEVDHRFRVVKTLLSVESNNSTTVLFDRFAERGLLVFGDGNAVKVFDQARGSAPSTIANVFPTNFQALGWQDSTTTRLLFLDGTGLLKSLSLADHTVQSLLAARSARVVDVTAAGASVYVSDPQPQKIVQISSGGAVSTLTDGNFAREATPACYPSASRLICRGLASLISILRTGGTSTLTALDSPPWKVVGDRLWSNNSKGGLRSVLEDGSSPTEISNSLLLGMASMKDAMQSLAFVTFAQDQWSPPYLQVFSESAGAQILDARTGAPVITYGNIPAFTTPRVTRWLMPFYRAFETGHPQIVQLVGDTGPGTAPFIELFMIRSNQPGLLRLTRFVP